MKHALTDIPGIGESTAAQLVEHGIDSVNVLIKGGKKKLGKVPGFGDIRSATVLAAAKGLKAGDKAAKKPETARAKAAKKAAKQAAKKATKAKAKSAKKTKKATKKSGKKGKGKK